MARVRVRQEISASADAVWAAIGELARAREWPAVESCEVTGHGVGCERILRLVDGAVVHERVEARDDDERSYRSAVFVLGHMPVKDYHYEVRVRELAADRCALEWSAGFEPVGVSEDRACRMIEGLYEASTITIREVVGAR